MTVAARVKKEKADRFRLIPITSSASVRAASYIDRILRGDKPADLPVQTPTRFETVVNLKKHEGAWHYGAPALLLAADEIIE